jgi:hypothetical protein
MGKASAIAQALGKTGARVAKAAEPPAVSAPAATPAQPAERPRKQASRENTEAITLHLKKGARRQLKALAVEEGRTVASLGAEALNLLFASRGKAEIATAYERTDGPR